MVTGGQTDIWKRQGEHLLR